MALAHAKRPQAGFRWEDKAAKMAKRKGYDVEAAPMRRSPYDLLINGKKVDVKAAIRTEYKGSDGYPIRGYVFTNMSPIKKCDFYLLLCLSPDRNRVEKTYVIPADEVLQRTVTITERTKYKNYENAWDSMKKKANLAVYRTDDKQGLNRSARAKSSPKRGTAPDTLRKKLYGAGGAVAGAAIGAGVPTVVSIGKSIVGKQEAQENAVNYKSMLGSAGGFVVGGMLGRRLADR